MSVKALTAAVTLLSVGRCRDEPSDSMADPGLSQRDGAWGGYRYVKGTDAVVYVSDPDRVTALAILNSA